MSRKARSPGLWLQQCLEGEHPPPPINRNLGLVLPYEHTIARLPGFPGIPEASGRAVFKASPVATGSGIP